MNWNSFVTSYRFILKSKLFTAINLVGLTAGLTVSFFLLIYIINELSYNTFHDKSDRTYRIISKVEETSIPHSPSRLPLKLQEYSDGIVHSGGLISLQFMTGPVSVGYRNHYQEEPGFFCCDPSLFDILSFRMMAGEGKAGLEKAGGVILSDQSARKYFGEANPIGQELEIKTGGVPVTLTVQGVFKKLPWNSTVDIDFLAGMDLFIFLLNQSGYDIAPEVEAYADFNVEEYILVDSRQRISELTHLLPSLIDTMGLKDQNVTFSFQNIRDIHLDSGEITNDFHRKGDRSALFYYGSLAFAILLLAGINYSILSTARSALRFKEIGVRKVLGATKRELRTQILTESMLLTFLALPLSFMVLGFVEPFVNKMYGYEIQLYTWNMLIYIPLFAVITLLIGLISGVYLAFYLSALNPLRAIKNQVFTRQRFSLSKAFIVFQLLITLFLFSCLLFIFAQLNYCMNDQNGIQKDNLLILSFTQEEFHAYPELCNRMRNEKDVESLSGSSIIPPTNASSAITFETTAADYTPLSLTMEKYFVDAGFFTTLGIKVVEGEDIREPVAQSLQSGSGSSTGEDSQAGSNQKPVNRIPITLNQQAEEMIGRKQSIGKILGRYVVTGIVRDFNIHSFYSKIAPSVFIYNPAECNFMIIRCKPGTLNSVRQKLEAEWDLLAPGLPFNCTSFDDELNAMYSREQKFSQIVASFSFLAFLITGMGLFGLALLIIERRLKEIAVRKIFGASNNDILFRMQKEFLLYILLASLISVPATWYTISIWLSAFYYKVTIQWYLFLIAVLSVTIFVSAIIMIRTWMVLRKNLINVLKYE